MLGGAAKGSFTRLDLDEMTFEQYYIPLKNLVREKNFDGLDLDVEEEMTLSGVIRLIDRLKADFGNEFLITLAPVASALMSEIPDHNLSGFSYEALEVLRGKKIAWYNSQFYCGWGDISKTDGFELIVARGFPPSKIVIGTITNPENGKGWVPFGMLNEVLITLKTRYPGLGGIMGWEYFNSLPGNESRPWEWAACMTNCLRRDSSVANPVQVTSSCWSPHLSTLINDKSHQNTDAPVPTIFDYISESD